MRSIHRVYRKYPSRSLSSVPPHAERVEPLPSEQHPEPAGHIHDAYRHWVWLGLHHSG